MSLPARDIHDDSYQYVTYTSVRDSYQYVTAVNSTSPSRSGTHRLCVSRYSTSRRDSSAVLVVAGLMGQRQCAAAACRRLRAAEPWGTINVLGLLRG